MWNRNCGNLKPKLLCGNGNAERQVAVCFLCGSGTMELPSIIPYAEAELRTKSHTIFYVWKRNLKSQYIPSAEVELRHRVTRDKEYSVCGSRS